MISFLIDVVAPLIAFGAVAGVIAGIAYGNLRSPYADETAGIGMALALIPLVAFAVWNSGYRQGRTGQSIGRRVVRIDDAPEERRGTRPRRR